VVLESDWIAVSCADRERDARWLAREVDLEVAELVRTRS
jgi:hypothetical protein